MLIEEDNLEKEKEAVAEVSSLFQIRWSNVAIWLLLIVFCGSVVLIGYHWMGGEVIFPFGCHTGWTGEHCHMYWNLAHVH